MTSNSQPLPTASRPDRADFSKTPAGEARLPTAQPGLVSETYLTSQHPPWPPGGYMPLRHDLPVGLRRLLLTGVGGASSHNPVSANRGTCACLIALQDGTNSELRELAGDPIHSRFLIFHVEPSAPRRPLSLRLLPSCFSKRHTNRRKQQHQSPRTISSRWTKWANCAPSSSSSVSNLTFSRSVVLRSTL